MGYHLNQVKYGDTIPKAEILWYGEPFFQSGTITGTFRHRDCRRFASAGTFVNSICSACYSIPRIDSFRLKLHRRTDSNVSDSSKTNFTYMYLPRDQLLVKLREAKEQVECYKSRVFLLSSELARVRQKVHSLRDKMKEFAKRGDISAIAFNIVRAHKEGRLKEKAGLMNIVDTISKNLCKKKKGKRYSATTKDFYEVLLTRPVCAISSLKILMVHMSILQWFGETSMQLHTCWEVTSKTSKLLPNCTRMLRR